MNNEESAKKSRKKKIKVNDKKRLILIITVGIILIVVLLLAIYKGQEVKRERNRYALTENMNKGLYTDMTSKEMYEKTRALQPSEKQGLVETFIKKWKQDRKNKIETIAENETHARYLFCN